MINSTAPKRRKQLSRLAMIGGAVGASMTLIAPTASAAPIVPIPGGAVCDPVLTEGCLSVVVNSGTFANNGFNLPIANGDMIIAGNLGETDFIPRDDGYLGVYSKPMTVPGGVLGIDLPFNNLFGLAGVKATVQAVEVPIIGENLTTYEFTLPVRMKIENAFLGDNCYIGSKESPVVFELKAANQPGDMPETDVTTAYPVGTAALTNVQTADTDFALPGATGCGPFGVLNPIVNWRAKVPNTTGTSLKTTATGYFFPSTEAPTNATDPVDGLAGENGSGGSSGS
ncbi:hypothetical protein [Rhodococcus sp. ARC_M6]|uniref:hypothetical protein n=1 Tax=Rhodococcus sp. ARC_M6 TaxID=2928852 RepID=UPI001FB1F5D3|nr:hypothetical protein [Rhodococcus sp. ARC_M6]MCJ0907354.1 hypothetical protein [Rhodococcus sp. ARC_M6]